MSDWLEIRIPEDMEKEATFELAGWMKKVGDAIGADEPIAEVATDKAVYEIVSPAAGTVREILAEAETEVSPGQVIARVEAHGESRAVPAPEKASTNASVAKAPVVPSEPVSVRMDRPAPHASVLRLARKYGVSLDTLNGTGRDGRVTRRDLRAALGQRTMVAAAPAASYPKIDGPSRSVRHDSMRRSIAANMANSVAVAPHVTAVFECDLTAVLEDRRARKAALAERGVKLTYTAYFLQACVEAIRAAPEVNSRWHDDALEIFGDVHIGVGTALGDRGLVVPVVRNVQDRDLEGCAAELTRLTELARERKLRRGDMEGSTFTVSNHGVQGTLIASPIIIRQPESAILGLGKVEERAIVRNGEVTIRPMMYVTLTIDHRALDAFHTNTFLSRFCEVLESWGR
ncbi:MAG: 2-oxo acid dehydrogenase subunit E2 [Myxococcota bacterium]